MEPDRELCPKCGDWKVAGYPTGMRQCLECGLFWYPQVVKFRIVRRTSQYNRYIKWYAETFREDGSIASSFGYRTQREARASIKSGLFPIGKRMNHYIYEEVGPA